MPELVKQTLPPLPAGTGKGSIFTPLPQDVKDGVIRAHAVQTVGGDAMDLYELWRKIEFAPRWMEFVVSVTETSKTQSHWVMGDPDDADGTRVEYDSEIVEDIPGKKIAWKSITNGIIESGEVTFEPAPGERGTRVTLQEWAKVPGGALGKVAAGISKRTPRQIVIEDLRHFKQLAEAGEIPSVVNNPHGPRGVVGSFKKRMYGENNPTPPGTSDLA